jgi:hypothetical protein
MNVNTGRAIRENEIIPLTGMGVMELKVVL